MLSHARSAPGLRVLLPFLALAPIALTAPTRSLHAQKLTVVPGFAATDAVLPPAARGFAALAPLPSGDLAAFDGQKLVTLDARTGAVVSTLATLMQPVFGSDIALGPTARALYFGDSSTGAIYRHTLGAAGVAHVTMLDGNFSFAFHPREGERFLYASGHPGFSGPTEVRRIDTVTGAQDVIAEADGYAGPIAFDLDGNLYYAPAPKSFSTPGLGKILRWSAAQVASAIGAGVLKENDATRFASSFNNAIDLVIDGEGTLYAADSFVSANDHSSLLEIGPGGGARYARDVVRYAGESITALAFAAGARPFERYGRGGSRIYALSHDFTAGTSRLIVLEPRRPPLAVAPSVTPEAGARMRYTASELPPGAFAIWLLGAGLAPEAPLFPFGAAGLAFPDFAIVPTAPFLLAIGIADMSGMAQLALRAPAARDVTWTTQALVGPVAPLAGGTPASPWITTEAQTVTTR